MVTNADDDDADNAGHHSTTTRATYRQKTEVVLQPISVYLIYAIKSLDILIMGIEGEQHFKNSSLILPIWYLPFVHLLQLQYNNNV